jgi:hypothetical protein
VQNKIYYGAKIQRRKFDIFPGQIGGLGIIDDAGAYFAARRWSRRSPISIYNMLVLIKDMVTQVYLENVNLPQVGAGGLENRFSAGANLLVNSGIWQGWLLTLELPWVLIAA